jgi:glycosyltransferase involved in cell wall biosynthesis
MSNPSSTYSAVSVVMATYNGGKYIEEQLDSILNQSLVPSELIICDDLSSDNTVAILEEYQKKGLLRYSINERRLGYVGNFKRAVSLASAQNYVALSDQDDIWLPQKLESAMRVMLELEEGSKPAMVYSDLILVDENKRLLNPSFRNELGQDAYSHCLNTLLFGGFVNGCTMLVNPQMRRYFDTIPESGILNHDTWISLIAFTFGRAGMDPKAHIQYRRHSHNATDLIGFKRKSRYQRLKKEIISAFRKNDLFEKELTSVSVFYDYFHDKLSDDQKKLIERFLKLSGRSYLEKKIGLRWFFRGKWKKG